MQNYDHYCPWVGNVVGKGNRHYFLVFLWLELGAIALSALVAVARMHAGTCWLVAPRCKTLLRTCSTSGCAACTFNSRHGGRGGDQT